MLSTKNEKVDPEDADVSTYSRLCSKLEQQVKRLQDSSVHISIAREFERQIDVLQKERVALVDRIQDQALTIHQLTIEDEEECDDTTHIPNSKVDDDSVSFQVSIRHEQSTQS